MNIELLLVLLVLPVIIIITICFIRGGFKNVICKADYGNCVLYSQFSCRPHSALLPNPVGENIYTITIKKGNVRLNHSSLNPDGWTWSLPPARGQIHHVDIKEGETKIINKKIGLSYEKPDIILIVNKGLFQDCEFDYSFKKIK